MDLEVFREIGLTAAEAKTYVALLSLGESAVGPVIEKSGLQSSVVHLALTNLKSKGFVSSVKEGKRNKYQASEPRHMLFYLEEKRSKVQNMLPKLKELSRRSAFPSEVTVFRGVRGVKELLYSLLEAGGKEHHTFGSSNKSLMLGDEWWTRYHKKRSDKGIAAKLLFNESLMAWKAEEKYPKSEIRYTNEGFEPLTETIIRNDMVGIIVWADNPIGILMHHPVVASSYDNFFKLIWSASAIPHFAKRGH